MTRLAQAGRRGQPLVVLGLLLAGWAGLRLLLWEDLARPSVPVVVMAAAAPEPALVPPAAVAAPAARMPVPGPTLLPPPHSREAVPEPLPVAPRALPGFEPGGPVQVQGDDGPRLAGAHQIAWIAGLAQLPVPSFLRERANLGVPGIAPSGGATLTTSHRAAAARRWSVDGWLLLRQGGLAPGACGLPPPAYGASQAGAVVRYRLAPASRTRPTLYLRATAATAAPRGEEAALGLALRPLPRVPVSLSGEVRVTNIAGSAVLRPAVMLVTELDRFALPAGLRGEAYGQAGYVGGRGGTPFADGQVRIDRALARLGPAELRAGGGAWGGVQRGAGRLDLGPSATLDFPLGGGQARLAADWRLRVAGQARPQSGPALTLSAGF
ncbi:MAG: hypothetical protein O9283_12780 [Sphingomonadaceae bacterium]|nr:hypothetical protein [Sphingomonadaceae bacterium]